MKPFIDAIGSFFLPSKPSAVRAGMDGTPVVFARRLCAPARAHLFVRGGPGAADAEPPKAAVPAPVTATSPVSEPAAV